MIAPLDDVPAGVLGFRATDRLDRGDLATVVVPPLTTAIRAGEPLRLLFEVPGGFPQADPMGAVRELKDAMDRDLRHSARLRRTALVTDAGWLTSAAGLFGFMAPGELKVFTPGDAAGARAWVAG